MFAASVVMSPLSLLMLMFHAISFLSVLPGSYQFTRAPTPKNENFVFVENLYFMFYPTGIYSYFCFFFSLHFLWV